MKKWRITSLVLIAVLLVGGSVYFWISKNTDIQLPIKLGFHASQKSSAKLKTVNNNKIRIAHIFVIMEENQPGNVIIGNSANAPYINSLINQYSVATNYFSVTHPSLPNYLAITSGSTDGITYDCNPPAAGCMLNVPNIADRIESSGRTWKEYAESMPSACYMYNYGDYATKHNPFVYYSDIADNKARCDNHVVPFTQLSTDLKSLSTTPDFAFITPNLCNDMHNCSVEVGDYWLSKYVPMILNSKAFTSQPSLLFITWDEGDSTNNNVAMIVAGSAAKTKYVSNAKYDHYSLLSTIETLWKLKPLTSNDKIAPPMLDLINPKDL